jgi:hypothetical protein
MATTYRKSSKGVAEIETRAHRLPPRLRSALIVIDGRRSADDVLRLIPQQGDEALATLLEQGFIETVAEIPGTPGTPGAAAPRPVAKPAPRPAAPDFDTRRRDAVRRLTDLVGPMGEALAIRMERCRSADELRPMLAVALQIITTRGRQAAADYQARFSDL